MAPPVLAPKIELVGGWPAGVVEGLPKMLPALDAAGVVEPNNEGFEVAG